VEWRLRANSKKGRPKLAQGGMGRGRRREKGRPSGGNFVGSGGMAARNVEPRSSTCVMLSNRSQAGLQVKWSTHAPSKGESLSRPPLFGSTKSKRPLQMGPQLAAGNGGGLEKSCRQKPRRQTRGQASGLDGRKNSHHAGQG